MRRLGISIYPDKSSVEEMKAYIEKAAKYGFSRIFTNLLQVDENETKESIKKDFIEVNKFAKEKGFMIIVDVSPRVFKDLDISYNDLSFFEEIYADGIRLDLGYGGFEEASMTYNPQNLKIELNMSRDTHYLDNIMDYLPNQYNLIACHNFYPHPYTGLTDELFEKTSRKFNQYGLRTAAFVSSQNPEAFGPWPVDEGIVTLERHRDMPIVTQVKDFISMNLVDDIIISNFPASDEEFEAISKLDLNIVSLAVEVHPETPNLEQKIMFEEPHYHRGDAGEYLIRSTMSRVKYKGEKFPVFNNPEWIEKGDVIIESSEYGHYAGELQIARTRMKNTGRSNVVGRVVEEEMFLLDSLKPWQRFSLERAE